MERGYSPSEAREIRAMASFHHPDGYAYGYIRFTQLIHRDGSKSDTIIEVNLRHPGENDRNLVCFLLMTSKRYGFYFTVTFFFKFRRLVTTIGTYL